MSRTFGELKAQLLRLPHGAGTHPDTLGDLINDAYEQILNAYPWTLLRVDAVIPTAAAYSTGTIAINQNELTLVGTGTAFTQAMQDRMIRIAGAQSYFTFGFTDATSGAIDGPYDDVSSSAATFEILQRIYLLPDYLREIAALTLPRRDVPLQLMSASELDRRDPSRQIKGTPVAYVPIGDSPDFISQIELWPVPDVVMNLRLRGTRKPARLKGAKETFLPWVSVPAILALCEARLYGLRKDTAGKQMAMADYALHLKDMKDEDNRRRPAEQMKQADRYTEHRRDRAAQGRRFRNWNSA